MPCPENPEACCPPPAGGGLVVPPRLSLRTTGWPGWPSLTAYLPWEVDAVMAFQPTSFSGAAASGHIIAYDGLFKRLNAPVAQSQQQVDDYLSLRAEQLRDRAMRLAAAKVAFHDQAGVEWPDYVGGGVVRNDDGPLAMGDIVTFVPFSYPGAACMSMVLRTDPVSIVAFFPDGHRTIRGVRVLHKGAEFNEFLRMQQIWLPLYNAAIAAVDAEYPVPA